MRNLRAAAFAAVFAALGAAPACTTAPPAPLTAPKTAQSKAPAPASEATVCPEHGLLQAVCTRCNPKLVPIFQAKGDWCTQHAFPESLCPRCHPERGGRPAADITDDGAPADGVRVRFKSSDSAALAGFRYATVTERPIAPEVHALASIAFDATRVAQVHARSAGVVQKLLVDVGAPVVQGQTLAIIESAEVGSTRSRVAGAQARARTAALSLQRETALHARGISSAAEVQAARQERATAQAELAALTAQLGTVGKALGAPGAYAVTAPISGTLTERHVNVGQFVADLQPLLQVVDASTVWALVEVPEVELATVATGQAAEVHIDSLPDRVFAGQVAAVALDVDGRTRTAHSRVALANPEGLLRANLFGRARIVTGAAVPTRLVPQAAVQEAAGIRFAFVRINDSTFAVRRLRTGKVAGELVAVVAGLRTGDEVVTDGSFLLKTETLKDSIGAGCCAAE